MEHRSPEAWREPKLLDQVRDALRVRHLSLRTEKAYLHWIRRYILFHGKRHPREMAEAEINAFLTHLAVEGQVSASTQTQALCALLFLYKTVLQKEVGELEGLVRAKRRRKLPVVLTPEEVKRVLAHLTGADRLFLSLAQPWRPRGDEPGGRALTHKRRTLTRHFWAYKRSGSPIRFRS